MDSKINNIFICSKTLETDTDVILIPNKRIKKLKDGMIYRFVLANSIFNDKKLFIEIGNKYIPIICKDNTPLYLNQINKRVSYPIRYNKDKFMWIYK